MLQAAFELEDVEKLRPIIQSVANSNMNELRFEGQTKQPVDLKKHFDNMLPTKVTFHIMMTRHDEPEDLAKDSKVRYSTSQDATETSNKYLQARMQKLLEQCIDNPRAYLVSELGKRHYHQGQLSKEDVIKF